MSNKIKKVLVCILTFVLIFSMIGCNPKAEENTENNEENKVVEDAENIEVKNETSEAENTNKK